MPIDVIICDWNGTLIEYRDEKPVLENTARDVFKASFPFHPFKMVRILRARKELEGLYQRAQRGNEFDFIREMFRVYNERIIGGTPVATILRSIERYAFKPQTLAKLDHRVLRPVRECHRAGRTAGVFSAGYGHGIGRILVAAGYDKNFDFIEADVLKQNSGRAVGFGLDIYKKKAPLLEKLLRERNIDAGKVAYLGDNEDEVGCFEMVKYPIVAFMAADELKQKFARAYKAFVPGDEKELASYLKSA
ncbi:MAG: haloacid dehalogenase-like hydrolase [Chloroflexi bacterium]|nr:haloacid dehalogenase-like hydrolase [Chloroflexota bacterium]